MIRALSRIRQMGTVVMMRVVIAVLLGILLHEHALSLFTHSWSSTSLYPDSRQSANSSSSRARTGVGVDIARTISGLSTDAEAESIAASLDELLANAPLPPYDFLIGTMERNEGPDILEWIFYHILIGFDHFVVYDHFSDDNTRERIAPLVELGWVTLESQQDASRWAQPRALEKFIANWKLHSQWLFFLDIDEFVARNETHPAFAAEPDVLFTSWFERTYGDAGGVAIPRLSFTSNGHYTRPDAGVMQAYTEARMVDRNFFVPKIMLQARFRTSGDIHKATFQDGWKLVDPLHKSGDEMLKEKGGYPFYLHHYWSKSWDECVQRIQQKAFPGSWRESMGDRFCRFEMISTNEHAELEHSTHDSLARYGSGIMRAVAAFEHKYPAFDRSNFQLSLLVSRASSEKLFPLPRRIEAGSSIALYAKSRDVGHLHVTLVTPTTKRYLPTTHRDDGSVLFSIPPTVAGFVELDIVHEYASTPSPERDPVSPCSIMGHIANQPDRPQLQRLAKGPCRGVDPPQAYSLATSSWPHPRRHGELLFKRFLDVQPADATPRSVDAVPLRALGRGQWKKHRLDEFGSAARPGARLYTAERCPRAFDKKYWEPTCGNDSRLASEGVFRWTPDGAESLKTTTLSTEELGSCLRKGDAVPRRILLLGDSVMSHTYMALSCMLGQANMDANEHLRFVSFQYEMFDLVEGALTEQDWERMLSWERTASITMPDVVVLNVGLWAATWSRASDYESGLEASLQHLGRLSQRTGVEILWRETTAVFPAKVPTADPLYQVNPRVQRLNRIANRLVVAAGFALIDAFEMTATRVDSARDNAHMCPWVQGDLAEMLMYGICRHVLG